MERQACLSGQTEDKCAYKQQIRIELVRRREENPGGRGNKSWLKDFIYEKWPYTKKDVPAFSRRRQYCYNLVFAIRRGEQVQRRVAKERAIAERASRERTRTPSRISPLVVARKLVVDIKQQAEVHASRRRPSAYQRP